MAALTQCDEPLPRAEIESALARARLAVRPGDAEQSGLLLNEALATYRDIGATGHAQRLAKELGT